MLLNLILHQIKSHLNVLNSSFYDDLKIQIGKKLDEWDVPSDEG